MSGVVPSRLVGPRAQRCRLATPPGSHCLCMRRARRLAATHGVACAFLFCRWPVPTPLCAWPLVQRAVTACWQVGRGAFQAPTSPTLSTGRGMLRMVSFCFFFFVNNFAWAVGKSVTNHWTHVVENGLTPGYCFPGCNPYCTALRSKPLVGDWMHPGPTFAGSIPDSLMGRWLRPSVSLV